MRTKPLISVVVTTRNEEKNITTCLKSVSKQKYKNWELLVVDNNSTDKTKEYALRYTDLVFDKGPERSTQRNFGAEKAHGEYLLFLDADMSLSEDVLEECMKKMLSEEGVGGIIIPEESYGTGFWAQCKKLERSLYVGIEWIEAARFFRKQVFQSIGGFDEKMVSGEDWDLSLKVKKKYSLSRITSYIYHNEGRLTLTETIMTKYYYAKHISGYFEKNQHNSEINKQKSVISRYVLFGKEYKKLFKHPLVGMGMVAMKTCEYAAGSVGFMQRKFTL